MPSKSSFAPSPYGPESVVREVARTTLPEALTFDAVYEREFAFVWRNLRRLGVTEALLRDAAQDVFLVVHRKLAEFEGRAPLRSWIYSIVTRVARQHRRTRRRKELRDSEDSANVIDVSSASPELRAENNESLRLLLQLLDTLDDDKREAFVLSDLEGLSAPEMAQSLGTNLNTIYSRVRAARSELRAALQALTSKSSST